MSFLVRMNIGYFHQKPDLLYRILKIVSRIAIKIYCRHIIINKPELLKEKGPLLLAANHPNSFLDSVILDTLFGEPVWSLARGDVFKKPFYIRLLSALKILPVYRTSEGPENVPENFKTFDTCIDIFRQNGVICIFSEGKCINEWHLRPLKKGTARLAFKAWDENIPLRVLPVGINYSSFHRFGKNMFIQFGDIIRREDFSMNEADGLRFQAFNNKLEQELRQAVFEIPKTDRKSQRQKLEIRPSTTKRMALAVPAAIGWLTHAPLFLPVKKFTWKRTAHNDHYDSVMMSILLFLYPLYLLLITGILLWLTHNWWMILLLLLLPFTAWSYVQLKPQIDK